METNRRNEFPPLYLNIVSYNIRGLKTKVENNDFMHYLHNFDIFILIETHTLRNAEAAEFFKETQPDFECLHWKNAEKVFQYGRKIGGCIIGIRKSLIDQGVTHSIVKINGFKVLQLQVRNKKMQIVPLYIRSADWDKEFEPVIETFENTESPMANAIVMGDVNVRLGELKQEVELFNCIANTNGRRSLDTERNGKGRKFLEFCDAQNLQILNGLTHGDAEGSFTCFSGRGNGRSTNDICAVSRNLMGLVVDFKVDSVQHGSDHLPICLQLNLQFLTEPPAPRALSIQHNSHSLASLNVTHESVLDSDISIDEVMDVLKKIPLPGFSENIGEVTLQCNNTFNCSNIDNEPHSNIDSKDLNRDFTEILQYIVKRRLVEWCEKNNILSNYQTRFSKGAPRLDTVYSLATIANIQMNCYVSGKFYAFFLQFESIFSEAFIQLLWNKLNRLGVSSKVINFLKYLYEQTFHREQLVNYFKNEEGPLSELMYSLYLNDLPEELDGGLSIGDREINMLMYADKIVLLSDTVSELQDMINRLEKYCSSCSLNLDLNLSEVLIFKRGRISDLEKWFFTGKKIKTTSRTRYLGFEITSTFFNTTQVQSMIADAMPTVDDFLNESDWTKLIIWYMVSHKTSYSKAIGQLHKTYIKMNRNNNIAHLLYIGRIHFWYSENSLVRYLNLQVIEENVMWAEDLKYLCWQHDLQWWKESLRSIELWAEFCTTLISLENS